jgi:type VI secretion system protein ImpE
MSAGEHYQGGRLREAIAEQTQEVRQHPTDSGRRGFLAELLSFAGDWSRADTQLAAISQDEAELALAIGQFRQLLRAEQARQEFYTKGQVPEFLEPPSPVLQLHLQASIRLRDGQPAEALALLAQAEEQRAPMTGLCNGQAMDGWRDLDDLCASFLEVLATNGNYYWVPFDLVQHLTFSAPQRPRDLLWRPAHLTVRGSHEAAVFVPVLYPGTHAESDDALRLGRMTDWRGGDGTPVRGVGQRTFLAGGEALAIMEVKELTLEHPADKSEGSVQ